VPEIVLAEETRFARTLALGLKKLEELIESFQSARDSQPGSVGFLPGDRAFMLYDTYGLPLDFIQDAAPRRGIDVSRRKF